MANSSKESQTKDKEKSLQSALSQIETQFGPGTIMRMGDREVQKYTFYLNWFIRS